MDSYSPKGLPHGKVVWDSPPGREDEGDYLAQEERRYGEKGGLSINMGGGPPPWSITNDVWVAHTDFRLPADIGKQVYAVDGVELVDNPSQYRVAVGIGKAFDPEVVKENVEEVLRGRMDQALDYFMGLLGNVRKHPYWIIAMSPSGQLTPLGDSDPNILKRRAEQFRKQSCGVLTCRELR